MNAVEKIIYFYDHVKLKNAAPIVEKAKKSLGVIISAAAVSALSLVVGAAALRPKRSPRRFRGLRQSGA